MPLENEHLAVPLAHGLGHIFRTLEELTAAPARLSHAFVATRLRRTVFTTIRCDRRLT